MPGSSGKGPVTPSVANAEMREAFEVEQNWDPVEGRWRDGYRPFRGGINCEGKDGSWERTHGKGGKPHALKSNTSHLTGKS